MNNAQIIFNVFAKAGFQIHLVGGIVRDHLIGLHSNDLDFATNARPNNIKEVLAANNLPVIPIGEKFGTIQTIINSEKIEITTYRCAESYTKGSRKPDVIWGDTLEQDMSRRDFTINAMAMTADGEIVDYFGGKEDLRNELLRTPIDAHHSFTDDPLRMLRAARFIARGIVSRVDPDVSNAMKKLAGELNTLSAERIFDEMNKLLMSNEPVDGLRMLVNTHIMPELFPELQALVDFSLPQGKFHHLSVWEHTLEVVRCSEPISEVRWAALFHDVCKPITHSTKGKDVHFYGHAEQGSDVWRQVAQRLKASNEFADHVAQLIHEHQNLRGEMSDKGCRRLVHRLGNRLENLFKLRTADILGHNPKIVNSAMSDLVQLQRRCQAILNSGEVNAKMPKGTGNKIAQALGIKPGAELGKIMTQLQQMLIDGDLNESSDFVVEAKKMFIR